MYAVVRTGGKQYKVQTGQTIEVERLPVELGETVELTDVLLIGGEPTIVGTPIIAGAKVIAESLGDRRGDKIIVFKYKPKVRYRRKLGHRQTHTVLQIKEILAPEAAETRSAR